MPYAHPALSPGRLGALTLRNRLAVAPMTRVSATPDGAATGEMADYYAAFACGGFGLIVTEGIYTDTAHSQGTSISPAWPPMRMSRRGDTSPTRFTPRACRSSPS